MSHPHDVVVLFPSFLTALAEMLENFIQAGLEIYPCDEQWFWQWTSLGVQSSHGFASLGDALNDALAYRMHPGYGTTEQALN